MSLKNSQHRESFKHEYTFGTVHEDERGFHDTNKQLDSKKLFLSKLCSLWIL